MKQAGRAQEKIQAKQNSRKDRIQRSARILADKAYNDSINLENVAIVKTKKYFSSGSFEEARGPGLK